MYTLLVIAMLALPLLAGLAEACMGKSGRKAQNVLAVAAFTAEAVLYCILLTVEDGNEFEMFRMTDTLVAAFRLDSISRIFLALVCFGFLLSGVFATKYMEHSERQNSFFAFLFFSEFALVGMDNAKNLITLYMFFEMATLLSIPLVLHDRTPEAIHASLKYLFYSVGGAFLGLLAIFVLARYTTTLDFTAGGTLDMSKISGHETLILVSVFLGVVGFGAKAGMYPLHGWLPVAHPVAPAPASAVLSGIIAKAGVLLILRVIFYIVGTAFLTGTWVQIAWIALALLTVFMGSMMAYREDVFKKRLAYSSVSQISYILTGLFFMTKEGVQGGLLQVLFHCCVKICLFLIAGSFIVNTGKTKVSEFRGLGKSMPITLWSFTIASLSLIGIPPAAGFVSKWYLALGSLNSGIEVLNWLSPVILLVSALLTAAYLLPITISGFFPGKDFKAPARNDEGGIKMLLPIVLLAAMSLVMGIAAGPIVDFCGSIASSIVF